jgi:transcriptional regulator
MYVPKHFEEPRVDILHQLIKAHPFGTLVGLTPGGLVANHIPFEIENVPAPFGMLQGHIARANTFWQECSSETEVLVIFQGPDAYISPSWYPSKKQHGKVVPTWNYAVVHAYGHARFINDSDWLRAFVEKLTNRHESGRVAPWKITDAPPDYIEKQVSAIVGLEIPITRLVGKWKLGQNRPPEDQAGMAKGLLEQGGSSGTDLAKLVSERQKEQS